MWFYRAKNGVPNFLEHISAHFTHGLGTGDIIIPKDLIQKWNLNACIRSITWDLELRMLCGNVYRGQVHITIRNCDLCQCRLEQKEKWVPPGSSFLDESRECEVVQGGPKSIHTSREHKNKRIFLDRTKISESRNTFQKVNTSDLFTRFRLSWQTRSYNNAPIKYSNKKN